MNEHFSHHEEHLRSRMMQSNAIRGLTLMKHERDLLLLDYYFGKGLHPDDTTLPINCWDETE